MGTTYLKNWVDTNGAPGEIGVPGTQGIFDESETQNMALGHRISLTDGRVYRYSYFVTATAIALLAAKERPVTTLLACFLLQGLVGTRLRNK